MCPLACRIASLDTVHRPRQMSGRFAPGKDAHAKCGSRARTGATQRAYLKGSPCAVLAQDCEDVADFQRGRRPRRERELAAAHVSIVTYPGAPCSLSDECWIDAEADGGSVALAYSVGVVHLVDIKPWTLADPGRHA
jgi:hypothetical protein